MGRESHQVEMQGILFTEPMFNAIRDGRKSQTRRMVKHIPRSFEDFRVNGKIVFEHWKEQPRYKVGDLVYVKEPYAVLPDEKIIYKYDLAEDSEGVEWKNKMFMPENKARIHICILDVQAEKLHDITALDAMEEGIDYIRDVRSSTLLYYNYIAKDYTMANPVESYMTLWDSINGIGSTNPLVWAYKFTLKPDFYGKRVQRDAALER